MRENKSLKLIEYLVVHSESWSSAEILSNHLHVSTRQIRKYIFNINNQCGDFTLISSSKQGYKIILKNYDAYRELTFDSSIDTPHNRQEYIIQKLITSIEGCNTFSLAEELYVSSPTIEQDLKKIRQLVKPYQLTLERSKDIIYLKGSESNKRAMMSSLLSSEGYNTFVLSDKIQLLSYHYHLWEFRNNIHQILTDNNIYCNDYTLNDIALHLIIMIDRIRSQCMLTDDIDLVQFEENLNFTPTLKIAEYVEKEYNIHVNNAEFYQLFLTIVNNSTTIDTQSFTPDNLSHYVDKKYIDITEEILTNIEQTYYLKPFDSTFKVKMTIHLWALFRRAKKNKFAKNPLTKQVKSTYPLIYDIAVNFAQQLDNNYQLMINEDEIAFLAFHIGSYFENTAKNEKRLTCMFVYMNYHDTQQITIDRLQQIFEDKINIKYLIPLNLYNPDNVTLDVDLTFSTIDLEFPNSSVIISPFITEKELSKARIAIDKELQNKRKKALLAYLNDFIIEDLFYKNPTFRNHDGAIKKICSDAIKLGYCDKEFMEDVFNRERISNTVFDNVAVPHALSTRAHQSFISFTIFEESIKWSNKDVNIIVLLGISYDSRKEFADIFDFLIDILANSNHTNQLIQSRDYNEFILSLEDLILNKTDIT